MIRCPAETAEGGFTSRKPRQPGRNKAADVPPRLLEVVAMTAGGLAEPLDHGFGALKRRKLSLDIPQSRQVVLARVKSKRRLSFL
jgi:hypothetical protein